MYFCVYRLLCSLYIMYESCVIKRQAAQSGGKNDTFEDIQLA
jgi:hypothetical protein